MDKLLNRLVKTREQRFAYAGGYSNGMWATEVVKSWEDPARVVRDGSPNVLR